MSKSQKGKQTKNIDMRIGCILRDIPYLWKKIPSEKKQQWLNTTKGTYSRTYIVDPKQQLKTKGGKSYFKEITKITADPRVLNYYMASSVIKDKKELKYLRINGHKYYIPSQLKFKMRMDFNLIYDYLNIKNIGVINIRDRLSTKTLRFSIAKVEKPTDNFTLKAHFSRTIYNLFFILNMAEQYNNVCIPLRKNPLIKNIHDLGKYYEIKAKISDPTCKDIDVIAYEDQVGAFNDCMYKSKKRFIALGIKINYDYRGGAHANILIFDKKTKEAELYDPWGSTFCGKEFIGVLIQDIKDIFNLPDDWKIIHSIDFCPSFAFQKFATNIGKYGFVDDLSGYCAVWSLWILENRLKNPDIPRETLIKESHSQLAGKHKNYREFIHLYTYHIQRIGDIIREKLKLEYETPKAKKGKLEKNDIKKINKFLKQIKKDLI